MTREQWLELCWRDFRDEVRKAREFKDKRGGQHVPLHNGLTGAAPSALHEMERWCKSALDTKPEYYEHVTREHFDGDANGGGDAG